MAALAAGWVGARAAKSWNVLIRRLLQQAGWVRNNYQGRPIPAAAGTALVAAFSATVMLLILLREFLQLEILRGMADVLPSERQLVLALVLTLGMGMLGLIDDLLGSRDAGGLRGHWQKWLREGEITTGLIKAMGGGCLALTVALLDESFAQRGANGWAVLSIAVDGLVIALMANWINLLDVRPGRALKGMLLKSGLLLVIAPSTEVPLLLALMGVILGYFRIDLQGKAMMGDVGANFLGAVLGYLLIVILDVKETMLVLTILLMLHAYTERHSLSKLIEQSRFLGWLDEWGREKAR
jgi:UDP-N-acetylmuramyl pentapeptide phosphotransferase/UDP-N-acetylglucosamine-1-phosphate transferase